MRLGLIPNQIYFRVLRKLGGSGKKNFTMVMTYKDRCSGMLLGLHAGDALGATLEFTPPSPAWNTHREILGEGPFQWKAGEATDDTDLMMCVLRSVESPRTISFEKLKEEMLIWFGSEPKDVGNTTIKGLRRLKEGYPLRECGFRDEQFQGNGSLMRVAPMALLTAVEEREDLLETQTLMTHGHELCVSCDRIFIASLDLALQGADKKEIYGAALALAENESPSIAWALRNIPATPWELLKTSGFCVETLAAAYWALLKFDNFEDAIVAVVNRGDDADTAGAVAGALCGAYYGAAAIPQAWREKLEFHHEILGHLERVLSKMGV